MVVADEQPVGVDVVGVGEVADDVGVKIFHHFVACEVSSDDRPALEPERVEFRQQLWARHRRAPPDDKTKAEPTALADLALDQDIWVVTHYRLEQCAVLAALRNHHR